VSPRFQLQLDRERCAPGETVRGTIQVREGGRSRSLEAMLQYKEETDDYLEVPNSISSGVLHEGDLATGTSFEFELLLPEDALPSYKSEHGELYWEVSVKSDEFGRDTYERRRIEIEPAPPAE
jgi:hypothetical protein